LGQLFFKKKYYPVSDRDYTGSVIVVVFNLGSEDVHLIAGESYFQLVPVIYFDGHIGNVPHELDQIPLPVSKVNHREEEGESFEEDDEEESGEEVGGSERGDGSFGSTNKKRKTE
jgi:dUTPase